MDIKISAVLVTFWVVAKTYSNGLSYIVGLVIKNFMDMIEFSAILIIMLMIRVIEQSW